MRAWAGLICWGVLLLRIFILRQTSSFLYPFPTVTLSLISNVFLPTVFISSSCNQASLYFTLQIKTMSINTIDYYTRLTQYPGTYFVKCSSVRHATIRLDITKNIKSHRPIWYSLKVEHAVCYMHSNVQIKYKTREVQDFCIKHVCRRNRWF